MKIEFTVVTSFALWMQLCFGTQAATDKPNVLLIMTDDQGWGDIASHGAPHLQTPVLDALADSGVRFDRFFVSPVCAPTRASLLTGRYSLRTGVRGVTRGWENMRTEEVTLGEYFRTAGYTTGCFGKWHNGRHLSLHPNGQGFDEFVGFCGGHWNSYFDAPLERNGHAFESQGYITDVLTNEAISFIQQCGDDPWFCYVPYNAPHSPWLVPDRFFEHYKKAGLDDTTACAYAMVQNLDENIGRLLDTLDKSKLSDNTIVVFLTDNGPNSDRFNGNMRGRKGSVHEGGVRVPLFIRWPEKIAPGRTVMPICAHIDLLPTLLDMCGVAPPDSSSLDGVSLWPLIQDSTRERTWTERLLFTSRTSGYESSLDDINGAVRSERWRATFENNRWSLFDMHADSAQMHDVAGSNSDITAGLAAKFQQWRKDVHPQIPDDPTIPIPIQQSLNGRIVELSAHEASIQSATGRGIRYAGTAGYANSWITDWTDLRATISWRIEVPETQQWKVKLLYACTSEDAGCQFQISCGDSAREFVVPVSDDAPFAASLERLPPSPHYAIRNWRELSLGDLTLSRGDQEIRINGIGLAGSHFAEIKALQLEPVSRVRRN
jgi:arylsulfatase A-like enzyme